MVEKKKKPENRKCKKNEITKPANKT